MSKISYLGVKKGSSPSTVNGKVVRKPYKELRSREYFTTDEIDRLMEAASRIGRHGHRDKTLILIAYRHALRVTELVSLRWDMIDLKGGLLHVSRLKNGTGG
jgi:integrase